MRRTSGPIARRPPATPAAVAGLAAVTSLLRPADANAAFEIAQTAAGLAIGLDDLARARAARAIAMGGIWVRPELVQPAAREALDLFGDGHPVGNARSPCNACPGTASDVRRRPRGAPVADAEPDAGGGGRRRGRPGPRHLVPALLRAGVEAVAHAGQSLVLVSAMEALAAVVFARGRPRHAAGRDAVRTHGEPRPLTGR